MAWDIASKTITENFTIAKVMHRIGAKLLYIIQLYGFLFSDTTASGHVLCINSFVATLKRRITRF